MAADGQAGGVFASGWMEDLRYQSPEPRQRMACLHMQDGRAEGSSDG